jgi:membrane protein implicated in regulation of membrane protease activity
MYWMTSGGPVRWKIYSRRYWAIRSISLASDEIIAGLVMAFIHLLSSWKIPIWFVALVFGALFVKDVLVMWPCIAVSRLWPMTGKEAMIGKRGTVQSDLNPYGLVRIENEIWKARADSGTLDEGQMAEVLDVDGLTLRVREAET